MSFCLEIYSHFSCFQKLMNICRDPRNSTMLYFCTLYTGISFNFFFSFQLKWRFRFQFSSIFSETLKKIAPNIHEIHLFNETKLFNITGLFSRSFINANEFFFFTRCWMVAIIKIRSCFYSFHHSLCRPLKFSIYFSAISC